MKPPVLVYTNDKKKATPILEQKPLTTEELAHFFPGKTKHQVAIMLRNPREMGKIFINHLGKYEVYKPDSSRLTVTRTNPQPFSPPPKFEFMYELGKSSKVKH